MSRDKIHITAQIQRVEEVSVDKKEVSSTYEILSAGHLQAAAHRARSYSMHTSRITKRDTGTKNKKYRQRRMSLPPDESRGSYISISGSMGHNINQIEEVEGTKVRRYRRSGSFDESQELMGIDHRRVRSFKTTPKGSILPVDPSKIQHEAKWKETDMHITDIDTTIHAFNKFVIPQIVASTFGDEKNYFRVLLIGARDVGKTTLINQFLTTDFFGIGDFNFCKFCFFCI